MARMRFVTGLFLLAALVSPVAAAEKPFRYPEGKHGKGELKYVNGIPVLTVEGTPEEIGEQVGTLAVKPAKALENYVKEFVKRHNAGQLWPLVVRSCEAMVKRMPEDHRKELDTIA